MGGPSASVFEDLHGFPLCIVQDVSGAHGPPLGIFSAEGI